MQNQQLAVLKQYSQDKDIFVNICNFCKQKKELKQRCVCKEVAYCSIQCKQKDKFIHKNQCPNDAESQKQENQLKLTLNSNKGRTGLRNLGSTSYMNSGLQCISHIKQLTDYFLENKYIQEINKQNRLGTKGQMANAYAKLIENLWYGTESSFSPIQLKKTIEKYNPMFSGYTKHDVSDLINYLLDCLHEDLNRIKQKPYVEYKDYDNRLDKVVADEAWSDNLKRNQSIIVDLMYGQYKIVLDCPTCLYKSIQFDPFLMVSLPIRDAKKYTIKQQMHQIYCKQIQQTHKENLGIENCFNMFEQTQILGDYDGWYCPKCKQFIQAKKQMQIYRAPKVLILYLKRPIRQCNIFVNYPVYGLDLSSYVINHELPEMYIHSQGNNKFSKPTYDLIGVSNRLGGMGGGHYTAYCKDMTTQQWWQFDDSHVSKVKQINNIVSQTAYVLFYHRRQ